MKKLLFFTSFFTLLQVSAQETFNRAYHDIKEETNPFVLTIHGDLYFTTINYYPTGASTFLYRHNSAGILKSRVAINNGFSRLALKSNDNKLLITGQVLTCDLIPPYQHNFISKVDTNGLSLFTATYTVAHGDYPKAFLQYSDSSYYSFTDSIMVRHSKTGQLISINNVGLKKISSALVLQNNSILVSAELLGNKQLIELSPTGTIITSVAFPILLTKLSFYNGQKIMGLGTDGALYKLSTSGNVLGVSPNLNNMLISDFVCSKDTVYTIFSTPTVASNYMVMDTLFTNIFLSSTTTHSISQNAICMNGSKVAILATGLSSISNPSNYYSHYFASLSSIDKFSSNNFKSDLALLSVQPDSTKTECSFAIFPAPGEYHCISYLKPKVTVKNTGNTTITQFKLNSFEAVNVACGVYFYQENFTGLSLLPGDSLTVTASQFARNVYAYTGPAANFSVTYCFYISLPNGETDKVLEDNQACSTANFVVTSLREYSKNAISLSVVPNPFENSVVIESDATIKTMELTNSLGVLVYKSLVNNKQYTFSNSELAVGVYFLKIETAKGTAVKKIVKN